MSKNILIITGAGASKSLTASLLEQDRVDLIGHGNFRQLPTGEDLIKQITLYQDKSVIWVMAYICYTLFSKNTTDAFTKDYFIQFANFLENTKIEDDRIHEEARASKNFSNMDQIQYKNFISEKRTILTQSTKSLANKIRKLQDVSKVIYLKGNPADINMSTLLNKSKYLQILIENFDNKAHEADGFVFYTNEIFFYLIYYAIASNIKIFTKIQGFLNKNDSYLLDFILDSVYKSIENLIRCLSELFSGKSLFIYKNTRRFQLDQVVNNSIYNSRAEAYDRVINDAIQQLNKYTREINVKDIKQNLIIVLENLKILKVGLSKVIKLQPLVKPNFMSNPFPDCGQTNSINEFKGLFGIENIVEAMLQHNISEVTLEKVLSCINTLMSVKKDLDNCLEENILEKVIIILQILCENGF